MSYFRIEKIDRANEIVYLRWLRFCEKSINSTIFHRPDFLAYHQSKFNEHHLAFYKGDALFAILPMATDTEKRLIRARSPYGASFGSFIFFKTLDYSESNKIVCDFISYCKENNIKEIDLVPQIFYHYRGGYSETFHFALLEAGFKTTNSDITSVVSLKNNLATDVFTANARNMSKKAQKMRVTCILSGSVSDFWSVMEKTFSKHAATPAHSKKEWEWLQTNLPNDVWCDVAYIDKKPIAGIGHFKINNVVDSSFYLCSDPEFQNTQALSYLISEALIEAQKNGFQWFDFGTSSVNMVARKNIFQFKESFGAIGFFRHSLKLAL